MYSHTGEKRKSRFPAAYFPTFVERCGC
jgi:hypothetical protein